MLQRSGDLFGINFRWLWMLGVVLGLAGRMAAAPAPAAANDLPNVVLIISDDQGWTDYGFMGHPHIQTPHLDRLASEGLTFTRGYVTAPLCRPSLASIITGLYPHQHGITGNDPAVQTEEPRYGKSWSQKRTEVNETLVRNIETHPTLPRLLGRLGYLSLQTGKWWEGHWKRGGFTHGMSHGDWKRGGRHGDDGLQIGRRGMRVIFDFIAGAERQGKPFFLWYAPFLPHTPHNPPKRLEKKYLDQAPTPQVARYWAMCEWFDASCGELLSHIEKKGMAGNTLVVYVCDNGWGQDPKRDGNRLPRSKGSPYEMGIRTPIMVKWPGRLKPRMEKMALASSIDIAPTILTACGLKAAGEMPGMNLMDLDGLSKRTTCFSSAYAHDVADVDHPTRSLQYRVILDGAWKLILPDMRTLPKKEPELYNIVEDPRETKNLVKGSGGRVKELKEKLDGWWKPE